MRWSFWRRAWRGALVVMAAVALAAVAALTYHAIGAVRTAQPYLALARQARAGDLAGADWPRVAAALPGDLDALHGHASGLRRWGAPALWLMQHAGWLPAIGEDMRALPHLLDAGIELIAAARRAAVLAPPALAAVTAPGAALPALLGVVGGEDALLAEARAHVAAAVAAQERVHASMLHGAVRSAARLIGDYGALLDAGLAAALAAPAAFGGDGPRTYLLIAQNSDELRASGGFPSAAGTITLDGGRVTQFELRDSYAGDDLTEPHPAPPEALQRLMGTGVLLLRDANWWPDFPTTARMTMEIWALDRKQRVDGVIALDEEGLRLIVEGLGGVAVPGEDALISAADLRALLREKWGIVPEGRWEMGAWWRQRKDFLPVLASAVLDKVQGGMSAGEAAGLARAVLHAIAGRHLQAYAIDPALQGAIERMGGSGAVALAPGDYLFVVDSNVGFNKVNAKIEQSIAYTVDLSDGPRPLASLTVTYTNHASIRLNECVLVAAYGVTYDDMMERCYWDYVRVYAPAGSVALLDAASSALEIASEAGKQVFASYTVTAPGASETLRLRYTLPQTVVQRTDGTHRYTLLVQKQGGVVGPALRVRVTLPAGARLVAASPTPAVLSGAALSFDIPLDRDRIIEVVYVP